MRHPLSTACRPWILLAAATLLLAACEEELPVTDGGAVASIDAGSGPPDAGSGTPDAGTLDAGTLDAGTLDAGIFDGGISDGGPLDAGTPDGGPPDAGPPMVTGVDCDVWRRDCPGTTETMTTFTDVPFTWGDVSTYGPIGAVQSELQAFSDLVFASSEIVAWLTTDGASYDLRGLPGATRDGRVLTLDFDETADIGNCAPFFVPTRVVCAGTTLLPAPGCWPFFDEGPGECTVDERDPTTCEVTTTTFTPRFWLAAGPAGPDSELRSDDPTLAAVYGAAGSATWPQEPGCDSYTRRIPEPLFGADGGRFIRSGTQVTLMDGLEGVSGSCTDGLGRRQDRIRVRCPPSTYTLSPAPP
jgi:hypothetical protein